jgi:diphthine-ammonia ligase
VLECQRHGHDVVALANLLPPAGAPDDLDSYMYQTVGHQLVDSYAACTGLPLFRRRIVGHAACQGLVYRDTDGDEVEDLLCLLRFCKDRVPGLQAVASGAIASDYQRTRVERVCARLGLVSLAYLWRQPQAPLLRGMIAAGIDAVLVKIAAAGLRPDVHLGVHLAELPPLLVGPGKVYGINPCGEGGEYETLTLDCPFFTRGRIVLEQWEAVVESPDDAVAPVATLHPTVYRVEPKGVEARLEPTEVVDVSDDYCAAAAAPRAPDTRANGSTSSSKDASDDPLRERQGGSQPEARLRVTDGGGQLVSLTVEVPAAGLDDTPQATADALRATLFVVSSALPALGLSWEAALFCHLYLPRMAHFGAANAAYSEYFPAIDPPSRATIQLASSSSTAGGDLPTSTTTTLPITGLPALVVDIVFARAGLDTRKVLHVQSISEWAPSCIGPYSQATRHRGLALLAGQIALDPGSMEMAGIGDVSSQCLLSLRSCQAVAAAVRADLVGGSLWWTMYTAGGAGAGAPAAAAERLRGFLKGKRGSGAGDGGSGGIKDSGSENEKDVVEEREEELDEYLVPPPFKRHWQPQLTFVVVPELPRG